jgi:hypothetical protein
MNALQQQIYYSGAKDVRLLAARRFGKTDGSIGPQVGRVVQSMPRGAGIWLGNSNKQLLTRTVPGTIAAIERFWGWKEGVHFWWGRPPKKLKIDEPIIKPKDWSRCISFYNGFVWYLVSLEVRGSANSLTVNYIIGDECRFLNKAKLDSQVMPTLSGITHPLGSPSFSDENPFYKGTFFASDAALSLRDNWMEKEEEKCDLEIESGPFKGKTSRQLQEELGHYATRVMYYNELLRKAKESGREVMVTSVEKREELRLIAAACMERKGAFKVLPNPGITKQNVDVLLTYNLIRKEDAELLFNYQFLMTDEEYFEMNAIRGSKSYQKRINALRCNTFAFYRASTLDNIDLLGVDYIAKMKRDLPPVVFAISILNMKKRHSSDGFYSRLDIENVHGYVPEACPAVQDAMHLKIASTVIGGQQVTTDYATPDFGELQKVKSCRLDGDLRPELPLHIAFDYNANINWVVVGQVYRSERVGRDALHVLSSMFTKNERKLRELVSDFNDYYKSHKKTNKVVYFYYDTTAKQKGYAISGQQDFKDVVIEELKRYGWDVCPIDMGRPMQHELKHKDINEGLAGITYPFILFNTENNEALIVAMENTGVQVGINGFRKDKSKEKYIETEIDPLQLRTDGTDAFDVLYLGVKYFQHSMDGISLPRRGN